MTERPSLTSQLQWAVVQAERRKGPPSLFREPSLRSASSNFSFEEQPTHHPSGGLPAEFGYSYGQPSPGLQQLPSPAYHSSPGKTQSNVESKFSSSEGGWHTELVWDSAGDRGSPSTSQRQQSSYLEELLSDEGRDDEDFHMLDDLLAYQMIHNELADMIGDVSSQMQSWEPPSGPLPEVVGAGAGASAGDVDSWVASVWSASEGQHQVFPPIPYPESCPAAQHGQLPVSRDKSLEEVTEMLLECGEAVIADDVGLAHELFARMRLYSSPHGTHLQRLAHYFVEALMARLNGTAADLYMTIMKRDRRAVVEAEKAYMSQDPTPAIGHHFAKSVLLETFAGADRVHIIDYGILGHQWQSLMQALAYLPEGPPRLRITGIELPQPGLNPDGMVKETGRKLSKFAASLGIPFEFKGIASKFEDVQVSQLGLRDGEVLAVSSMFRLKNLMDDSVVLSNPRRTVLERICSMNPKVFIMADRSLAANAPFMMTRLREAIPSWYSFFEFLESVMPGDSETRRVVEQESFSYRILNMVACEGMHRSERPEAYHQWHWRLLNAGFEPVALTESVSKSTKEVIRDYKSSWTIGRDQEWILTGWKGRVHHAFSAWKPVVRG